MDSQTVMKMSSKTSTTVILLALLAGATPGEVVAQVPAGWNAAEFQMTREDLNELLARYDSVLASPAYSNALKSDARRSAELIRERLEEGDFRVGDRIVMDVEGETAIPDTVTVQAGPAIAIPGMGSIPLEGVLRSELEYHLTREIGRFVRDPRVSASSLVRLSLRGAVGNPGFHTFPSDMLLGDVLMEAGGPAGDADLEEIRVRRGTSTLMAGREVRTALDEGRSIDQLGLQAGDEITVPQETQTGIWPRLLRASLVIASSVFLGRRIFF